MGRIFLLGALPFLMVSQVSAGGDLKATLLAREIEVLEAIKSNDQPKLKAILGQQAFSIDPSGRRNIGTLLKVLGNSKLTSYKVTDVKAIRVSDTVGILSYKYTWSGTENGKRYDNMTSYSTSTWELRDGQWVSVFYQETPVQK